VNPPVAIRPAIADDARHILEAHSAAVHRTAAREYASDILSAWAAPLDDDNVQRMAAIIVSQSELLIVAEIDGRVVGFGSIVPKNSELRAVYVHPDFGREGVGSRILSALEELARQYALAGLTMDASLNAEEFYRAHGYVVVDRGEHSLRTGARMRCVRMQKTLTPA
jgi:putative acetyltransferase